MICEALNYSVVGGGSGGVGVESGGGGTVLLLSGPVLASPPKPLRSTAPPLPGITLGPPVSLGPGVAERQRALGELGLGGGVGAVVPRLLLDDELLLELLPPVGNPPLDELELPVELGDGDPPVGNGVGPTPPPPDL